MMKEEINMDKAFREKLKGFEAKPPAHVWNGIQGQLAAQRPGKRMVFFRWAAVAALMVLALVAAWHFNDSPDVALEKNTETNLNRIQKLLSEKQEDESLVAQKENISGDNESVQQLTGASSANREATPAAKEMIPSKSQPAKILLSSLNTDGMKMLDHLDATLQKEKQPAILAKKHERSKTSGFAEPEKIRISEDVSRRSKVLKKETRWKMGVNISPGYSSYSASHGAHYASNMTYAASGGNGNLGGGVSVQYKTSKRLRVESGVYYAQNGQQTVSSPQFSGGRAEDKSMTEPNGKLYFNTTLDFATDRMDMNGTAGVIEFETIPRGAEISANLETSGSSPQSLLTQGELSQIFDFLEIPLYLRYMMIDSKIDVELVGGLNAGVVVGNNAFIDNEYGMQNIGKTRDISTVNLSGTLGVGVTYALGKHISLAVEPRLNYYLNSINHNPDVEFRPYRVGVYTGLYYEF